MSSTSIEIPLRGSSEVVEVFLDELPEDPQELIAIIFDEQAPLHLYLQFAVAYYSGAHKDVRSYQALVRAGLDEFRARRSFQPADTDAFVELSTSLAAWYILEALRSTGETAQQRWFGEANVCLGEAEKRDQLSEWLWLRRGILLLAKGSYEAAQYQFNVVLEKVPGSIPGQLGMACVAFGCGKYKEALGGFQAVLKALPGSAPTDLRLAIGYCFARLGFTEAARHAFSRVLALNDNSSSSSSSLEALVGLAVLNLNDREEPGRFQEGMRQMKEAYERDRSHPVPLLHLGNHFFFRKDYIKAEALLRASLSAQQESSPLGSGIRAECCFMLGKLCHQLSRMDEAHQFYSEAVTLSPGLLMAQFGLGQCLVVKGDLMGATGCLERVLASRPDCKEAARLLGLLLLKLNKDPERAEHLLLSSSTAGGAMDQEQLLAPELEAECCLALASLSTEQSTSLGPLQHMKRAQELLPERFETSPVLLNNLAVYSSSDPSIGKALLEKATGMARPAGRVHDILLYNKARLLESTSIREARQIYQSLLKRRPDFVKAHLRLGLLSTGQDSIDSFKEAIGHDESCLEAWLLLANGQLKQRALTPARKSFERILAKLDRHDLYSLVSLGNIHLETAHQSHADARVKEESLRRALEFHQKALSLQPRNHLAAMGIAVVLAELGRWSQSRDILLQVRLADPSSVEAATCLGHCFVELGQFGAAINAYDSVLPSAHGKQKINLSLYLARALYLHAKAEQQPESVRRAIALLREAEERLPKDLPIKYNVALCKQELASILNKNALGGGDQEEAQREVDEAISIFTGLKDSSSSSASSSSDGIDQRMLAQRLKWCDGLKLSLSATGDKNNNSKNSNNNSVDSAARQAYLQDLLARRAAEHQEAERLEASRKAAWETEQARIEAARKEMNQRLRLVDEKVRSSTQAEPATTSPAAARSRSSAKARRSTRDHGDEQEDHDEHGHDANDLDEDEEVIPRKRRGRVSTGGRPSALSKDFISTDDDEDELKEDDDVKEDA